MASGWSYKNLIEFDLGEGNLIRVSEEFQLSEFELRWLNTVLAVCEYMSFAKL